MVETPSLEEYKRIGYAWISLFHLPVILFNNKNPIGKYKYIYHTIPEKNPVRYYFGFFKGKVEYCKKKKIKLCY